MNPGASVVITSTLITISEVAAHHQGPHHYHHSPLHSDGSVAVFSFLITRYTVLEAKDFAWITSNNPSKMILEAFVYIHKNFDTMNLPQKSFLCSIFLATGSMYANGTG